MSKTAEEITNLYLYGTTTPPANLADESLIRPRNTTPLEISDDGNIFMQTGPGRIALPVLWDVVNEFFDLNRGMQPGTYTEQQLRTMFGISKDDAVKTLQQYNYDDGLDNYAERFYIWNSGSYEIDDSAVFVVDQNGNRHIDHFAVIPLGPANSSGSHGGILDNFDFEGGGLAQFLNGALEAMVDPSGIGVKVNIEITNVTNFRSYTIADFIADKQKYNAYHVDTVSAAARMATEGYDLVTRLFDNGSIKFLDSDNKPILYGSDGDDVISGTTSKAYKDGTSANIAATLHPLSGWIQNGIHYIGGAGNDILTGTGYDDTLEGGEDNDLIDGSQGNDTLDGGTGSDQLKGGDGQDTYQVDSGDILEDSDGQGAVWLANVQLHGGVKKSGESQYTDNQGHRYQLIGGTLLVTGAGGSLTISHFNKENKDLGIELRDEDKNEPLGGFPDAGYIVSPIVLDLNGDGLTTVSVDNGVYFDHDGNGFAELTGWINRQDGLLVRDLNGDGKITSGRELFGSNTLLADGRKAGNGYLALAELGGNHDGLIDAQDAAYAELKIWQDQNGDGRSQTQELLSLSQAQVQSIATAYTDSSQTDHGNALKQIGSYLRADGSVGQSADLWFQANAIYSVPTDPLPETPAVAALPNASGYRNVYDLHQAMLHDGSGRLQALVQQFVDAPASQRFALVDDLIFTWLGVDSVPMGSRGSYIDARQLSVLEILTDRQFIQGSGTNAHTPNPGPNAAKYLTGIYNDLTRIVYQELMDSYFTPLLDSVRFNWNVATGRFDPDVTDTAAALRQLYTQGGNALLDIGAFADILNRHGDLGTTILNALLLRDDLGSDLTWLLAANSASQTGSDGNDALLARPNGDQLFGLAGEDMLIGSAGADLLDGGAGNDQLTGGPGNDIYWLHPGDGQDTIYDFDTIQGNQDSLLFDISIVPSDVSLMRDGYELLARFNGSDQITVQNFGAGSEYRIEQIDFADGTRWLAGQFYTQLTGMPIIGSDSDDLLVTWFDENGLIQGLGGNDSLYGNNGNDTLAGGAGNDTTQGGSGNDDYLFNPGDGQDIFIEDDNSPANLDTIRLGAGIASAGVALARSGYDLVVSLTNSNDRLTVQNFGLNDSHQIERIAFADGPVWEGDYLHGLITLAPSVGTDADDTLSAWVGYSSILQGLAGNDTLNGANGNDTLDGGVGDDMLLGGSGNDDYLFNPGDGQDILIEDDHTPANLDTIRFGAGITDVVLARSGYDLIVSIANSNDRLTIKNFGLSDSHKIERIEFADGAALEATDLHALIALAPAVGSTGNDTLNAWTGYDSLLQGLAGNDMLNGANGNDTLDGGLGADTLIGGAGDDYYVADSFGDVVSAAPGQGIDILERSFESNYYLADNVENLIITGTVYLGHGNALDNRMTGNAADNHLAGWEGNDTLYGLDGHDSLFGGAGADTLVGGVGDDYYQIDAADTLIEASDEGNDMVRSTVSYALPDNVERLALDGSADLSVTGNGLSNGLWGNIGNDQMYGLVGNDVLHGGAGADALDGGVDNDSLYGDEGDDLLIGSTGNDYLAGNAGNDTYVFNRGDGQDNIDTNDLLIATDTLRFGAGIADTDILVTSYFDTLYLTIKGSTDRVVISNYLAAEVVTGSAVSDHKIDRVEFANGVVWSSADLQTQLDRATNNHFPTINFFLPTLVAPVGLPFTYTVPSGAITDPDPWDSVAYSAALADGSPLPAWLGFDANTLTFLGIPDANSYGSLQIRLIGTDDYNFSSYETVTFLDFATPRQLTGTDGNDTLNGGYGNDTLMGLASNDRLLGQAGADTMIGGSGDDYYEVDDPGDTLTELAGEGNDDVRSTISFTLPDNIERLIVDGAADLSVTGNALNNGLWGNVGNNQLYGLAGNDVLYGRAGADVLDGGADNDSVYAEEGDDLLIGSAGNDYLIGNAGNDTYLFNVGDGQDTIDNTDAQAAVDTLRFGAGIGEANVTVRVSGDSLYLNINGSGDRVWLNHYYAADTVNGDVTQDHKLDRVEFADGLVWNQADLQVQADRATNNHSPVINSFLPTLQARAGSAFDYTVPVDTITDPDSWDAVSYSAKLPDGLALPAWLHFDVSNRIFSGTPGGGDVGNLSFILWGTDNYGFSSGEYVNLNVASPNRPPVVAAPLTDQSATLGNPFNYTLPATAFTDPDADPLSYSATLADGSALPVWLTFNPATRVFNGTPDALISIGVLVTATDEGGLSASDVFAIDVSIQNLMLTGTSGANALSGGAGHDVLNGLGGNDTLIGNAGNDTLDGGSGNDTLQGGADDDNYVVNSAGDAVIENPGEGNDSVQTGVNYALAANVENLTLTGSSSLSATGNELNNVLTGNSSTNTLTGAAGNDRLDGKAGADKMIGRTGDDIYVVDKSTDTVTENANEGTDGVESAVTLTLAANVENLTLTGTSAINGTGNGLANALTGNNANNSLSGAAGNDSLDGKGGNDTLTGGIGGDSYLMARGYATDTVVDSDGTAGNNDLMQFLAGISADQIWFAHPSGSSNLTASIIGTNDSITIKDWYLGTANHVEQLKTYEDHRLLSDGNVQNLVDAMAGFTTPILGQTTLPDNYLTLLAPVIADNWMAY